ncbi:MAG TPA: 6,7-dimethyl-8-ribityllumazine synthase [Thermoanaerobaculia bacterium]
MRETSGVLDGSGRRFAVVAARFNPEVCDALVAGAVAFLHESGVAEGDVVVVRVPGAWELPLALETAAASGRFHGLVAIGAIVRGETMHYELLATESTAGIARVSERYRLPIGYGLLTCETLEQAAARAGGPAGDKGREAAKAALELATLLPRIAAAAAGAEP